MSALAITWQQLDSGVSPVYEFYSFHYYLNVL